MDNNDEFIQYIVDIVKEEYKDDFQFTDDPDDENLNNCIREHFEWGGNGYANIVATIDYELDEWVSFSNEIFKLPDGRFVSKPYYYEHAGHCDHEADFDYREHLTEVFPVPSTTYKTKSEIEALNKINLTSE